MIDFLLFSNRLKELRKKAGISQKELAETVGVSYASLSSYENGSGGKIPSMEIVIKIADYFNVSIDWLLGRDTKKFVSRESTDKTELYNAILTVMFNTQCTLGYSSEFEPIETTNLCFPETEIRAFLYSVNEVMPILTNSTFPDYVKQGVIDTLLKKYISAE